MSAASERAYAIASAFAVKPEHKDRLAKAIEHAINEAQRDAQAWRPLEVRDENGNKASLQLHCDANGVRLVAFNPIMGTRAEIEMTPVRKPAQREEKREANKAGRVSRA